MKDDYVSSFGRMKKISQFVYQHKLIILKAGLHACAVHHIVLYGKVNNQKDDER